MTAETTGYKSLRSGESGYRGAALHRYVAKPYHIIIPHSNKKCPFAYGMTPTGEPIGVKLRL